MGVIVLIPEAFEPEFRNFKNCGVLRPVEPEKLPRKMIKTFGKLANINFLAFSCSDGHQFQDTASHTFQTCSHFRQLVKDQMGLSELADDCFHWFARNGGPFVLSVPQLAMRERQGKIDNVAHNTICEIEEGMSLKKLNVILLHPHVCCGKVANIFTRFDEYIRYAALAKERLMTEFNLESDQVILNPQIHCREGRRTFHADYSEVKLQLAA